MNVSGTVKTHIAVLLFGLSGPLGVLIGLPAMELSTGRSMIAALAILLVIRPLRKDFLTGVKRHVLAGLLLAFHWYGFFYATIEGSIAWGLLSFATYPFWTILFRNALNSTWPNFQELISVGLILIGTFMLVNESFDKLGIQTITIGLTSAIAFAVLQIRNSNSMKEESSLNVAAYQMLWAGILLIPFCSLSSFHIDETQWMLFLFHGLVITAFSYSLFLNGLHVIGERKASFIAALEPVYGLLIAMLFMGIYPAPVQYLAAVLILTPSFLKEKKLIA